MSLFPRQWRGRLGLVCAAALLSAFVWLGWKSRQARAERQAVAAIEVLGGRVWYDYHRTDTRTNIVDYRKPRVPELLLEEFGPERFGHVVEVRLSRNPKLMNGDLVHLRALPHVKTLFVCGGYVTGGGLENLCHLPELEDLTLGISLNDDDLRYLAPLKTLKEIYLLGHRPGDYSVHSRGSTLIYDDPRHNSDVTDEGIRELASQLPGCRITY